MNCIPEKENLLLAYRDKFTSIKQTYPEWSDTDVRLQTAADLRPQFRLNRDAGRRENLGLSEYEVPEAAFTLTEDGSVWYTKYGQGLLELHERQLRLTPDTYSPEEHAISRLAEEHFKQGATSVIISYGDRDLVVMHFDPITKLGTTKIIDATKQQSTVQEIAKKRYAHLESLHLTDKIFLFTDKKLSIQHATEVIEPIMKQRIKTKLRFEDVQQFVSMHQKQEDKHIQSPFYERLFAYADDSFRQEGQKLPEIHALVVPEKLEPEHVVKRAEIKPFAHLPLAPIYSYDKRPYGWIYQKEIWDSSVRTGIIDNSPKLQEDDVQSSDNSPKNQPRITDRQFFIQQTKQKETIRKPKQVIQEVNIPTHVHEISRIQTKILFQINPQPITEQIIVQPIEQEGYPHEVTKTLPIVLPLATYIGRYDKQIIPTHEKVVVLSLVVDTKRKYRERTIEQYISVADYVPAMVYQQKEEEQDIVTQQIAQETIKEEAVYEVDRLMIQDVHTLTAALEKQVIRGEFASVVTKLLWMMPNNHDEELVPVEEVEIAQNPSRTIQNLLHFLRKVVQKYVGDDTIHERIVQRIASDKWDNEIEEIAEYLIIIKTQRMYNHLFAVVN